MKPLAVRLEDNSVVPCRVVERRYEHSIGMRVAWVEHEGREFMAVRDINGWRKWSAADRTAPLRDIRNLNRGKE